MEVTLPGDIRTRTTQLALVYALEPAFCKSKTGFISTPVADRQPQPSHTVQGISAGLHAGSTYDAQLHPFWHLSDVKKGDMAPWMCLELDCHCHHSLLLFLRKPRICKQGLFSEASFITFCYHIDSVSMKCHHHFSFLLLSKAYFQSHNTWNVDC